MFAEKLRWGFSCSKSPRMEAQGFAAFCYPVDEGMFSNENVGFQTPETPTSQTVECSLEDFSGM